MIAGVRGRLVSQAYLATSDLVADVSAAPVHRWAATAAALLDRAGPATSPRALFELLVKPLLDSLGFEDTRVVDAADGAVIVEARAHGRGLVVIVVPWRARLEEHWRRAVLESRVRRTSWCLLANGDSIRIVDPHQLYARRFVQVDLAEAIARADGAAVLQRLASARALCSDATDAASLHTIVAASDRHAAGVCRSLRDGVLAASGAVLQALVRGSPRSRSTPLDATFEQALTIVYRILFLLFAEARGLVPLWHPVYRESYSIEALRDDAERARAAGVWDALRAIARLAHAGCTAGDLTVTPFNGRLFAPARTPLAERRNLDDDAANRAILALSTRPAGGRAGRERIVYRDLGVEQLGAVYETLLDYRPRAASEVRLKAVTTSLARPSRETRKSNAPSGFSRTSEITLEPVSGIRKATGTFYTPQPLADFVVRRTLAPLVRGASPDAILRLRIVDPSMGSGAFLVAACRYLSSAYEDALVASGACHSGDIGEADRPAIRRLVAERCLYGVDLNPMAVQLGRLSLWLATLAADRPLSFLDHRFVAGDSVIGAWLTDLRRAPRKSSSQAASGGPSLPFFDDVDPADALRAALPVRFSIESSPNDTVAQVRDKERALAALGAERGGLARWKRIADVWCAAWFAQAHGAALAAAYASLADEVLTGAGALPPRTSSLLLGRAASIAAGQHFFHWELEFPEVFFDAAGQRLARAGFDAVIGNPPWEMLRADARRRDGEAAGTIAAAVRFSRDAGAYTAQSDGHANQYQLFVERAVQLTRPGGRFGLVLPAGLAADHGSAALRRLLFDRCDVDAIVGVDNRRGIFPIHRSVRFLLVAATVGHPARSVGCRFGIDAAADLESLADEPAASFPVQLSPAVLERLSGSSLAIPYLPTAADLGICEKAAALFRPLGDADGWRARFGRELNASDDADAFRADGLGLPVVDGRHLAPFRVALEGSRRSITAAEARRRLGDRFTRPRLGYRDVAGAGNRLTLIAAILPAGCVSTHTVFCLRSPLRPADQWLLCGLFNSLVVNYFVRLRVVTHVTTAIVERLPMPTPAEAPGACRTIAALARLLARGPNRRAQALLNARVAELYQLTRAELSHVLDTFPLIPREERDDVLREFRQ